LPAFCWTSSNLMWAWRMAFFRIPCHRELIEGDRVHAHDQSLDRGVSADAFGELCWLPDQLPDSLRSGARLRMCTIHDGEPELARLPRLRKSQIKGILGPPGQSGRASVARLHQGHGDRTTSATGRAYGSDEGIWNPAQDVIRINAPCGRHPRLTPGPLSPMFQKKEPRGTQGSSARA
jgi:hypothetical protein